MFIVLRSSSIPYNADPSNPKPVIVRVKRKSSQSPLEAFCVSHFQPHVCAPKLGKFNGSVDSSQKLPVFGLASYKFKGPMWAANELHEHQQASSLYQAADNWIRRLQVDHSDYRFFAAHNTGRR
ncbi:hypothetical protein Scep_024846 [Stephania cephalantha]|uniref:Uncharacterized protein n=1 Tax=Stephania cephalantha TaxID=152367 RepID=A0AAP0HYM3_9MAGN